MGDTVKIDDIHGMSIEKLKEQIGNLDRGQLMQLRGLETAAGPDQERVGALAAIDAQLAKLPPETPEEEHGGDEGAVEDEHPSHGPAVDGGLQADRDFWKETAAQYSRDLDYYRGLVEQIGAAIGVDAHTADDGSMSDSVLNAKVPELVLARLAEGGGLTAKVAELEQKLRDAGKPSSGPDPVVVPTRPLEAGPMLKLFDGDTAIEAMGVLLTEQRDWSVIGGASVLNRPIIVSPDLPRVTVSHVRIVDADGQAIAECEIPGAPRAGAGVQLELPAGSLAFAPIGGSTAAPGALAA